MQFERARTAGPIGNSGTGKVIADVGYGNTKFGVVGDDSPAIIKNIVWDDDINDYKHMIERKKLESMACDWEAIEKMWERIFEEELEVEGENCNVGSAQTPMFQMTIDSYILLHPP
eukprot:SAG11_NODE_607_length_8226_cov_11.234527_2_plen_116_part_00